MRGERRIKSASLIFTDDQSDRTPDDCDPRYPVMIEAYGAGVPGNGKHFPDDQDCEVHWKPKRVGSCISKLTYGTDCFRAHA
jgi:hypothetical protein